MPVLPLADVCLFPESSLSLVLKRTHGVRALEMGTRAGGRLLAAAQRDTTSPNAPLRELHEIGTVALISENTALSDGARRIELDGLRRARIVTLLGTDMFVAEIELLDEGDPGDEWGGAVEALARYLHAHAELRSFLDQQRRSKEPMSWVNLACQHLPITSTARQRLLDADARERCLKIGRGLDALLRKEQGS
jgi:ATP-dependent Lon protease